MKCYVVRYGQVTENPSHECSHFLPMGDPSLSELGRDQACSLGMRLRDMGFRGMIISSPYICTLETAEIVAKEVACPIIPYAPIREVFMKDEDAEGFRGLTIEEIKKRFQFIDPDAKLDPLWWCDENGSVKVENRQDVESRVRAGIERLAQQYTETDLLIVSHGLPVTEMVEHVFCIPTPKYENRLCFNCSLSTVDTDVPQAEPLYYDTAHLLYEKTTSNFLTREDYDRQFIAQPWPINFQIPEEIHELTRPIILHISDSCSWIYPYFRALFEKVKPDIIFHTGDMADEVKVGRIPETRYEYLSKIKLILDILENSGARVIITPGNNDLPDEIKRLSSKVEVYPNDTVLTLNDTECRIGHGVTEMTFDKDWSFYGHGYTGESWIPEDNEKGIPHRFNACWGAVVCNLKDDKYVHIPVPGNELWIPKSKWPLERN